MPDGMLSRAIADSFAAFDTTPKIIGLTVVGALVTAWIVWRIRGTEPVKKHIIENVLIVFGGAITTWILVFVFIYVRLPYKMLREFDANLKQVIQEKQQQSIAINSLRDEVQQIPELKQKIKHLENAGPRIVTRSGPAPEPEKRCWLSNYFWGMPDSTVKGAVTATAAILHCNHRVEAPYVVQVEFDRDFIPVSGTPTGAGVFTIRSGKNGKIYIAQIDSPALIADEIFVVTVYGETNQHPRPLRGDIQTLK